MFKINKFFIPYIIFLIIIGFKGHLLWAFLIVSIHELIHYIAALHFGFSGFDMEILPVGTVLRLKELDEASPKQDLVISISAPIANIIVAVIFYFLYKYHTGEFYYMMFMSNLALGMFNLIPALPLDGGRILRDILSMRTIYKKANEYTVKCSIVVGIVLMFYYFYLFFLGMSNFNIGIIAVFIIISSLKERERIAYLIMGDIIKKKLKFLKRGYLQNINISVYYKKDLITALSIVDKNRYNIFTILDDDMHVLDVFYEEELIEALKDFGNITIDEFIKLREENM